MGVPTSIGALSTTASSNDPQGTDAINAGTGPDDYFRAHASFIAQLQDEKAPKSGATISGAAITSSTLATTAGAVTSGSYSPTLYEDEPKAFSTAPAQWLRVGDVVTVSGKLSAAAAGAGSKTVGLELPIASTLAYNYQCCGTAGANHAATYAANGVVNGDVSNARASLVINLTTDAVEVFYTYTYRVL